MFILVLRGSAPPSIPLPIRALGGSDSGAGRECAPEIVPEMEAISRARFAFFVFCRAFDFSCTRLLESGSCVFWWGLLVFQFFGECILGR